MADAGTFAHLRAVREAGGLDDSARQTLNALVLYADAEGRCWPSVATLARTAGLAHRTTQLALGRLIAAGLITTPAGRTGGGRTRTVYILNLLALRATANNPPLIPKRGAPDAPLDPRRGASDSSAGAHLTTPRGAPDSKIGAPILITLKNHEEPEGRGSAHAPVRMREAGAPSPGTRGDAGDPTRPNTPNAPTPKRSRWKYAQPGALPPGETGDTRDA